MNRAWQVGLLLTWAAIGCGATTTTDEPGGVRRRPIEELPKVGDYLPPLDGNRLEVAGPEGWKLLPQGRTFLTGFAPGKASELPRITVNAADPPAGSPAELTEEEAPAMAAKLDQELKKAVAERRKTVEEFSLPVILGDTVFIRHVRRVELSRTPCVVQSLQTIKNSRLYTVELIVEIDAAQARDYEASLTKKRDFGYAVAAHMRFALPGQTFDPLAGAKLPEPEAKTKSEPDAKKKSPPAKSEAATAAAAKAAAPKASAAEKPKAAPPAEKKSDKNENP